MSSLRKLARRLRQNRREYVTGGDWNLSEEELQAGGALAMFDGSVIRPAGPTCMASGRIIDYFLVSRGLLAQGAQVVVGSPVYPRAPVFAEIAK
eukprot:5019558-Pyramimonas_sp.AAC.1